MVLAGPFPNVTVKQQCDVPSRYFGLTPRGCCAPIPATCVQGGWPPFDKYGYTWTETPNTALSWAEVKENLFCRNQAFAFTWLWDVGGSHMMVGSGYVTDGADQFVCVNNPLPMGSGQFYCHSYNEYVSGTNHRHGKDFYNLVKLVKK